MSWTSGGRKTAEDVVGGDPLKLSGFLKSDDAGREVFLFSSNYSWSILGSLEVKFCAHRQTNFLRYTLQDIKNSFRSLFLVQLKMPDNTEYLRYQQDLKDLSSSKYKITFGKDEKVLVT